VFQSRGPATAKLLSSSWVFVDKDLNLSWILANRIFHGQQ